jgi:hypothetical protein
VSEGADRVQWGVLVRQFVEAPDAAARAEARAALDALHDRRRAEADAETQGIVEAYGGDPVVGTVIADGPVIEHGAWFFDVRSSVVVRPDGSLIDRDELLAQPYVFRPRPPAPPPTP